MKNTESNWNEHGHLEAYALGALDGDEAGELAAHLKECAPCRRGLDALQGVVDALAERTEPVSPPPSLRDRVMERASRGDALTEQNVFEHGPFRFVRTLGTPTPGSRSPAPDPTRPIELDVLSVDRERGYRTILVRMQAGSRVPPHRHHAPEESFVLSGSLVVAGVSMFPGDYCRAEAGSEHRDLYSPDGCTFIAVASMHDQRIESTA